MKKRTFFLLLAFCIFAFFTFINSGQLPIYQRSIALLPVLLLLDFLSWKILEVKNVFRLLNYFYALIPASLLLTFVTSLSFGITYNNIQLLNLLLALLPVVYIPKIIFVIFILAGAVKNLLKKRKKVSFLYLRLSFIVPAILFFFLMYKTIFPVMDFNINKQEITINKELHTAIRVAHISDLHLGSWLNVEKIDRLTTTVNKLKPDLIFVTGDLVNFSSKETSRFDTILNKLDSKHGVYSVLGNHDYGNYIRWSNLKDEQKNLQSLIDFKDDIGWNLLLNESVKIINETDTFYIAGVENWGSKKRFPKKGDLDKALKYVDNKKPILLLSHDPSHWEHSISKDYPQIDITFSGHSHAGQIGSDRLDFGVAKLVTAFWGGTYKNNNDQYLIVNKGIGFIGIPFRIGIRPEITEITIQSKD